MKTHKLTAVAEPTTPAQMQERIAQVKRDLQTATTRVLVLALHKNGSQPLAIAQHTGLNVGQVRDILNLPL